ncbi:MAG: DUF721 domain-containing protein [Bacteroidota bacterium]
MVRLREALDQSLRRIGIMRQARRARAIDLWPEVVGKAAASASRAMQCKDGVLFVWVRNSVWANELSLLKADIIKKLNRCLGRGTIVDVRFQARGSLRTRERESSGATGEESGARLRQKLTSAEMDEIRDISSAIADPALREAFSRALAAARMGQDPAAPGRATRT